MKPLADAQRRVLDAMTPLPVEEVPLAEALGLVLAEPVRAGGDIPPFANSKTSPPAPSRASPSVPAGRPGS